MNVRDLTEAEQRVFPGDASVNVAIRSSDGVEYYGDACAGEAQFVTGEDGDYIPIQHGWLSPADAEKLGWQLKCMRESRDNWIKKYDRRAHDLSAERTRRREAEQRAMDYLDEITSLRDEITSLRDELTQAQAASVPLATGSVTVTVTTSSP